MTAVRIVLVDDVPEVRRLVRLALRFRGGFEVVAEAADGGAAVRMAAELCPDLMVLDLGLPDIAGHEVLTRVRRASPATKVVVFSGLDTIDRGWIDAHAAGFVLKDADLTYLIELLESLGRPGAAAATSAHASIELAHDLLSVRHAGSFVREQLSAWGADAVLDDAMLVVSELATNALTHAGSAYCCISRRATSWCGSRSTTRARARPSRSR